MGEEIKGETHSEREKNDHLGEGSRGREGDRDGGRETLTVSWTTTVKGSTSTRN